MSGQVHLMQTLHNDDATALLVIIKAVGHRLVPPLQNIFPVGIASGFLSVEWIVTNYKLSSFTSSHASIWGSSLTNPHSVILVPDFGVLVQRQLKTIPPTLLKPI